MIRQRDSECLLSSKAIVQIVENQEFWPAAFGQERPLNAAQVLQITRNPLFPTSAFGH